MKFGISSEIGRASSSSVKCVTTKGDRTETGPLVTRSTAPHRPMSLSGGHGLQSTQLMPRSCSVGANVSTATTLLLPVFTGCNVELIGTVSACDLRRIRDTLAVNPDIGTIIDAAEPQPERAPLFCRGNNKRFAIPPAAAIGTVVRHWHMREVMPYRIARSRNPAQVVPIVRIFKCARSYLHSKHRGGHGREYHPFV